MAKFEGSIQEFHHYIGPRIRNAVNSLARKERTTRNGVCEGYEGKDCGKINQILESAHIHGSGRRFIIEKILSSYAKQGIVRGDIESIEKKILGEHIPVANIFKFLCRQCHVAYDKLVRKGRASPAKYASHNKLAPSSNATRIKLRFYPADEKIFKTMFIQSKRSYVLLLKGDGTSEPVKEWNARRFMETSNLRGNIFSGYLRDWKEKGIIEAKFAIRKSDLHGAGGGGAG